MRHDTKNTNQTSDRVPERGTPVPNDNQIEENITAVPKDRISVDAAAADGDLSAPMEFGDMNLEDAKESGYTDENGKAVSMAKKDVTGSPTGAYTDIGAGRSSAVHKHSDKKSETHH